MTKNIFAFGRTMNRDSLKFVEIAQVTRPESSVTNDHDVITSLLVMPEIASSYMSGLSRQGYIDFINLGIVTILNTDSIATGFEFWMPDKDELDPKFEKTLQQYYNQMNIHLTKMHKENIPFNIFKALVPDTVLDFTLMTCSASFIDPANHIAPEPDGLVELSYYSKVTGIIYDKYSKMDPEKSEEITKSNLHTPFINGTDKYMLKMKFIDQIAKFMTPIDAIQGSIKWDWQKMGAVNQVSSHLKEWNEEEKAWYFLNPPFEPVKADGE